MNAIEALGSTSVLCVDKTGTLTENRQKVAVLWTSEDGLTSDLDSPRSKSHQKLLRAAAFASDETSHDPIDCALSRPDLPKIAKTFPMARPILASGTLRGSTLSVKGAPESVLALCSADPGVEEFVRKLAKDAYRVIAVAQTDQIGSDANLATLADIQEINLIGLIGFQDPIRAGAKEAIATCLRAGIRVIMMTGDYLVTAKAVAQKIGITGSALSGKDLEALADSELEMCLKDVSVLARMVPTQKLRVVRALQASQEVVAMTGDGVNDAPALKAAQIGIAMGARGTDVAREAASVVLLEDDFAAIVKAIAQGRRIHANLRGAVQYIFSIHVPIVGLSMLPILSGSEVILWPTHLALLELMIDPICSIAFESATPKKDVMEQSPRSMNEPLFNGPMIFRAVVVGSASLFCALSLYFQYLDLGANSARYLAFSSLIFANMGLVLAAGANGKKVILTLLAVLLTVTFWARPIQSLLHFGPVSISELLVSALSLPVSWLTAILVSRD